MSPLKRTSTVLREDSSDSDSPRKRARSASPKWANKIKLFIVQTKIEQDDLLHLFDLIETSQTDRTKSYSYDLTGDYRDADVIITNIGMKKRLLRHVDWDIARQKPVVNPSWLHESIALGHPAECGRHAALEVLHDETVENCPDDKKRDPGSESRPIHENAEPVYTVPVVKPTHPRVLKNWTAKFACQRASPLVCVNQALAQELSVLGRARELDGLRANALSYEKSTAIIKSYPHLITSQTFKRDIVKLPGLGAKTLSKIEEFIDHGFVNEARQTRASERFKSLNLFTSVYGIGPTTARKLYEIGLRTVEDMENWYDIHAETPNADPLAALGGDANAAADAEEDEEDEEEEEEPIFTPNGRRVPPSTKSKSKTKSKPTTRPPPPPPKFEDKEVPDMSIKYALLLREDLDKPIPRVEVEEMYRIVMKEVNAIMKGCIGMIVGGYRRGKQESNDVDIVISHPDLESGGDMVKGLCKKVVQRLHSKGLVTHVMHLSSFHAPGTLRTANYDCLEKALTVFKPPPSSESSAASSPCHRRVDLIFTAPEAYWTAIIGWSGSRMFERDLRSWAKEKGLKFDSTGLTRRRDSRLFLPKSEQEVFDILGLDWIDPTMRNANA